jgi:hypothetical protein
MRTLPRLEVVSFLDRYEAMADLEKRVSTVDSFIEDVIMFSGIEANFLIECETRKLPALIEALSSSSLQIKPETKQKFMKENQNYQGDEFSFWLDVVFHNATDIKHEMPGRATG